MFQLKQLSIRQLGCSNRQKQLAFTNEISTNSKRVSCSQTNLTFSLVRLRDEFDLFLRHSEFYSLHSQIVSLANISSHRIKVNSSQSSLFANDRILQLSRTEKPLLPFGLNLSNGFK